MIAGNVLMDRNAPQYWKKLIYLNSKEIIDRWHNVGRCKYAITPRFAITSTPLMEVSQSLIEENNSCYIHLSENIDEIKNNLGAFS